jgi:hypothetical protein
MSSVNHVPVHLRPPVSPSGSVEAIWCLVAVPAETRLPLKRYRSYSLESMPNGDGVIPSRSTGVVNSLHCVKARTEALRRRGDRRPDHGKRPLRRDRILVAEPTSLGRRSAEPQVAGG